MHYKKTFWIVFREGDFAIKRLFKRGFGHVYAITKDDFNWIGIDPQNRFLRFEILPYKTDQDVAAAILNAGSCKILEVEIDGLESHMFSLNPISLLNCVSQIKYLLGLRVLAQTPYRLYRRLLRMRDKNNYKYPIKSVTELGG